jgi:Na+-translocating ferredoxin:NAD+ oxidoreductase RnfD subunit
MAVTDVSGSMGVALLVGATVMADMVAKACSSPQTAEINADKRAATLMKWVNVGLIEGSAFVILAAVVDRKHALAFLAGGGLEGAVTYFQYRYAMNAGLASPEPGTEDEMEPSYAV